MLEGTLHVIDTFTKRKSVTKQRDEACKQDINRILFLDSDSLGFKSFGFGILNCPSLVIVLIFKGKGNVMSYLPYRAVKLPEHALKIIEKMLEKQI